MDGNGSAGHGGARFPLPSEIADAPGAEGWRSMYPYFTRFQPEDDKRFWFYNSMHFPEPMPAFDTITAEIPYSAIGANTARVFVFPTTLGIEHRIVNGRVYITANPVTDPEEIGRRAAIFGERAGYYYENWDTLYQGWKTRIKGLIDEIASVTRARTAGVRRRRGRHRVDRRGAEPLRAGELPPVPRPVLEDVAPPHRVPDARLRRLRGVLPVLQAGVPGDQRPGGGPHGGRHRRDHVPARRRAPQPGPGGRRGRGGRPVHRGMLAVAGAGGAGRPRRGRARPGWPPSSRRASPGSTCPPATASITTTAAGPTT